MKRIFTFVKMKYFAHSYTVSRCNNCSFIKLKLILPTNFLRPNEKRI